MPEAFPRILALWLLPCFLVDPSWAAGGRPWLRPSAPALMSAQAVVAPQVESQYPGSGQWTPSHGDRIEEIKRLIRASWSRDKTVTILMVCYKNYFRSVALQAILRYLLEREGIAAVIVESAGVYWNKVAGQQSPPRALKSYFVEPAVSMGIPDSVLKSLPPAQAVTADQVRRATFIVAVGPWIRDALGLYFPEAPEKTFLFTKIAPKSFPGTDETYEIPDPGLGKISFAAMLKGVHQGLTDAFIPLLRTPRMIPAGIPPTSDLFPDEDEDFFMGHRKSYDERHFSPARPLRDRRRVLGPRRSTKLLSFFFAAFLGPALSHLGPTPRREAAVQRLGMAA